MNNPDVIEKENRVLDFSTTLNPFGMPTAVRKAAIEAMEKLTIYPDAEFTELRRLLSYREGFPASDIVIGNGGDDIIFRTAAALRPQKTLIFSPCSSEYSRALEQIRCNVTEIMLSAKNNFRLTSEAAGFIDHETDVVILNSPVNPTGEVISPYTLGAIADKCRRTGTVIVCDERYMDFVANSERYTISRLRGVKYVIIKSFTRMYSMAGLPVGYALCSHRKLSDAIRSAGAKYGITAASAAAAEAAVRADKFAKLTVKYIDIERRHLTREFTRLGLHVYPSKTSVILIKCDIPLDRILSRRGIKIRNCSEEYGLEEGYFRISVRLKEDNDILIETLERVLQTY